MQKTLIITCLLLMLTTSAPAVETDTAADRLLSGLTATYTASLSLGEDAPVLPFRGTIALSDGHLRITVSQDITLEEFIALVDYEADSLTLLYPDTLNGKRFQLADFDHLSGFARIRDVLAGKEPRAPEGWLLAEFDDEMVDGVECTLHKANNDDDTFIEWWTRPDGMPVRAVLSKQDTQVVITVADYSLTAAIDPAIYTYSSDYTITDSVDGVPDGLPSL